MAANVLTQFTNKIARFFKNSSNRSLRISEGTLDGCPVFENRSVTERLLENYMEILRIPSPSGQEKDLRYHLAGHARAHRASIIDVDRVGNLLIHNSQSPEKPRLYLTAHMDNHIHEREKMTPRINTGAGSGGPRVENRRSSVLGGDDKVAIALMMTLLEMSTDPSHELPPLGFLYTVHEENITKKGWSYGARQLSPEWTNPVELFVAMDVPSGNRIKERNFAVYHMQPEDPLLEMARNAARNTGIQEPYLEWEKGGYIGGDATTLYRHFGKKVLDFGTGNFNEHTRKEYTDLCIYLEQARWLLQFLREIHKQSEFAQLAI